MAYNPIKRDADKAAHVGEVTRAFLAKYRLTLEEAGTMTGYTRQAWSLYKLGRRVPPQDMLAAALAVGGPIAEDWARPIVAYSMQESERVGE